VKKFENNKEDKKNLIGNVKTSFSGRKFKSGAYVTAVSAVVIVIVLIVNMLVSKMNLEMDLTTQNLYTLTEDTKNVIKGLSDDITIYFIAQTDNEAEEFKKVVEKYDALSDKISLVYKDPTLYPKFASQFVDDEIEQNSLIVVNNTTGVAKYVSSSNLWVQEINYQTYSFDTTGMDVEGQLTSAIQYVTSNDLPVMYVVEGHGEAAIGDYFKSAVGKMNISLDTISTLSSSSIPEDCNMLYINAPESDFSDAEATMIKDFLTAGGKAIITLDYNSAGLKNFLSILDYYGIQMINAIVMEGDISRHMAGNPVYIAPNLENNAITEKAVGNDIPVLLGACSGLAVSDTLRSTLTVEPILTTTDKAYAKNGIDFTTVEKEAGDIDGPFNLGITATDNYNGVTSQIVVFSTELAFDDDVAKYSNFDLLSGSVNALSGDSQTLSIPSKSFESAQVYPSGLQALEWSLVLIGLIPLAILITGIVVCYKRRKK